ncbi:MAG: DUF2213 domain-containing protein, partial [Bacteroidaceae bacterium]|nr:DUF2213 domain-containing protein [Bacteroidaceae bacterium]
MKIVGDMAIKDLTPKSTNIGDRIVKNLRICGSGIYTYARREADLLHLAPVPQEYDKLEFINVYRPPEVLEKYKSYFARVPIITGHHVKVDRNNAHDLVVGMVGDTVESEVDKDDGETYLYTTGTIVAGDGVDAYERYGQLSVGYDPIMKWKKGVHNGVEYQAELVGFNDVNHLLICKVARGGPQCMVMDSLDELSPLERFIYQNQNGGKHMLFAKIFGSASKKVAGDEGRVLVPVYLDSIAAGANPKTQVEKIRAIVGDSNDEFKGFLDELAMAGDEKPEVIAKAVEIVKNYYNEHMAGDEKEVVVKKDGNDKNVEVKKDGKETKDIEVKKDGDKKDVTVKEAGDEDKDKDKDKKSAGDGCMGKLSGDEIDAIAQKTAAIMLAA